VAPHFFLDFALKQLPFATFLAHFLIGILSTQGLLGAVGMFASEKHCVSSLAQP